uniref:Uncharacterized protein n=1 Tax=viral metagenome TaxID=1070528 RepID=A0A6C0HK10_9ZZZZ
MSASRAYAIAKTVPTNVTTVNTISYYDNEVGDSLPIPFTVSNGVLDIAVQDNVMIDILTPESFVDDFNNQCDLQASIMGGLFPVSSLGPNMVTFLKIFIANEEDSATDYNLVTNIEIYNAPTMTKLRFNYIYSENTWQFDNEAPVKITPNPVSGNSSNNYRVVHIFKSPMVISYKYDGNNTRYLTFTSAFDSI